MLYYKTEYFDNGSTNFTNKDVYLLEYKLHEDQGNSVYACFLLKE